MTGATTGYAVTVCLAVGVLSWFIRAAPFLLFGRNGRPPETVRYVGRVLSPAAIAMLAVYCYAGYFRDRPPCAHALGAAEWLAGALVVALQLRFRNPLLAILSGTALYMALIRCV